MSEQQQQEIVIATQAAELARLREQVFNLQQEVGALQTKYDTVNRDGMSFIRRAMRAEGSLKLAQVENDFLKSLIKL